MNRTQLDYLFSTEGPAISLREPEEDSEKWVPGYFYSRDHLGMRTVRLRGNKMTDLAGLMNEFGAAFQFFEGFGENANALEECLCYLDEWIPADGYIVLFTQSQHILKKGKPEQLASLLGVLQRVFDWWSKPIVDNDPFNRSAKPFHSLFLVGDQMEETCERYRRAAKIDGIKVQLCDR